MTARVGRVTQMKPIFRSTHRLEHILVGLNGMGSGPVCLQSCSYSLLVGIEEQRILVC